MFKRLKQKYKKRRQNYLIKLAKKNGAYIPPTCKKSASNWYTSRKSKSYIGRKAT